MAEIDWRKVERLLTASALAQGISVDQNPRSEPGVWIDDDFLSFEQLAREVAERIEK